MAIIPNIVRSVGRGLVLVSALGVLGACAGTGQATGEASAPAPSDYPTYTAQFAELTKAAVSADYPLFAKHIGAQDAAPVVAALTKSFRGQPFDAYTRRAVAGDTAYLRFVELRNTTGRLYLFLAMDKTETGWNLSGYELTRKRAAVEARLTSAAPSG